MRIEIRMDDTDPPGGEITVLGPHSGEGIHTLPFVGWLGLLRALSEALAADG